MAGTTMRGEGRAMYTTRGYPVDTDVSRAFRVRSRARRQAWSQRLARMLGRRPAETR